MTCRSFEGQGKGGVGGGNGKGWREGGSTSLGMEEKQENVIWPDILLLSLSLAVYVGWQEWRQETTPPPSPTLRPLFTHSHFMTPPFPSSPSYLPPRLAASSGRGFSYMIFPNCTPHSPSWPTGVSVHHNSLGVEVC